MKTNNSSSGYILYIGNYLNEQIVKERGLPTRNPAGSNRMRRIAEAIKDQKQRIAIVSPAVSLRIPWRGTIYHSPNISRAGKVPVLFCGAVGLPFIGSFLEPFFILLTLQKIAANHCVKSVVLYNFSPTLVLISLWIKCFWKVPIFNNIEDISQPKLIDWLPKTEARPLQQIIFSVCMMATVRLCQGVIIPTMNFAAVIPNTIPFLNISGCMPLIFEEANCESGKHDKYPIRLLFAGKIESEHGIEYLIETLSLVARDENIVSQFEIDICGKGSKSNLISKFVEKEEKLWVNYHGFVSNANYQQLLSKADVCIALQNPNGRYGTYKTPSKVYEYLGNGKMVITTKAGDLGFLPSDVLSLCDFDDGQSLYKELAYIANNSYVVKQKSEAAGRYARQNFAYDKVGEKLLKFLGS